MSREARGRRSPEPFYLEGTSGPLYAIYFSPAEQNDRGFDFLYVPPFAEEMNRSRGLVTLQAQALAEHGIGILVLDLFGTGDSAGDFVDARWSIWLSDIRSGVEWLRHRSRHLRGLWGLRLGALLAAQHAVMYPDPALSLLLWQPVLNGSAFVTQFLRLRVAASMGTPDRKEDVSGLRARLASGEPLEIAGYVVHPELIAALDGAAFATCRFARGAKIDWIDIQSGEGASLLSLQSKKLVDVLRAEGVAISTIQVTGAPFWLIEEPVSVPELTSATGKLLGI